MAENKNLGIPNTSRSSALGPASKGPDLQSLLQGTNFGQNLQQSQALGQRAEAIQGQEEPTILQRLLSPGGLALLAGSIAAGVGSGTGAQGALAFGLGGLPQIGESIAREREERGAAVKQLLDERDELLDKNEKSMNRFTQLFNTNPEALEGIDENLLGILATGENIRLSTTARRRAARTDADLKRRHEVLLESLQNSTTVEDARTGVRAIFNNMDWLDVPEEVVTAAARSLGTPDFDSTLTKIIFDHGGSSALNAIIAAREQGVGLEDPGILSMIDWNEKEEDSLTPSQRENLKLLQLDEELNKWSSDPANVEKLAELRQTAGEDEITFQAAVVQEVFAGRSGDINFYTDERGHLARDGKWRPFMAAWAESGQLFNLARVIASADPKFRQMGEEEQIRYQAGLAFKTFKGMLDSVNEVNAFDDATKLNNAAVLFIQQIPNMDKGRAQALARAAILDATDQTGRVNEELYEQILTIIVEQHLRKEQ